jgi:MFS transporter, SP family, galactose:H+ symporter
MIAFPVVLAITWACLMYYMPESPRWYLVKSRHDDAYRVFALIYDTPEEITKETERAAQHIESLRLPSSAAELGRLRSVSSSSTLSMNIIAASASINEIASRYKLSIIVSVALMIFQNFSGNAGILVYAPEFFKIAGYGSSASGIATITLGIIKVVSTLLTLAVVDRFGRRRLLLVGISGMITALIAMSILLSQITVHSISDDDSNQAKISPGTSGILLFLVCIYVASYGVGYGPVTWLIVSELFPDEIRGRTLGFATIANWLSTLIVVATFLSSVEAIGLNLTLAVYAVSGLVFYLMITA